MGYSGLLFDDKDFDLKIKSKFRKVINTVKMMK